MTGLGRNDPCPCGSGRKHKRCCGAPTGRPGQRAGYGQAERSSARAKLFRFVERAEFADERAIAEALFRGPGADALNEEEWAELRSEPMVAMNFACFLALDLELADETTLLDRFLERRGYSLSGGERRYLEDLRGTRVGVYEVADTRPGETVRLKSLVDAGQPALTVAERSASRHLERGQLVAARVLRLPSGSWIFDGEIYPFREAGHAQAILAELEDIAATARAHGRELSRDALQRRASFRINNLWLEQLFDPADPARPQRPRRAEDLFVPAYPYLYAHLTDYLDGDDLSWRVPREARHMALYLGRIAAEVSRNPAADELLTTLACRRRPSNRPCGDRLRARQPPGRERVDWDCPSCGDAGTITAWRGTPFDLSGRAAGERVELAAADHRHLLRLSHLSGPAVTLLVAARPDGEDEVRMEGAPAEFRSLARCIARELVARAPSRAAARRLARLHALCARAGGEEPELSFADAEVEAMLEQRARRPRLALVPATSARDEGYRVHVRLLDVEPPVWRRLELPSRITLDDLNDVLVLAMGWTNSHLHLFEHERRLFAPPETLEDLELRDSRAVVLRDLLRSEGDRLVWEYDLGDSWRHELELESIHGAAPERPRLLDGARACPPEDSGGPPGYAELVSILADPMRPEHQDTRAWAGPSFDPERFDLRAHDRRLERLAAACAR